MSTMSNKEAEANEGLRERIKDLEYALEDMLWQFAYRSDGHSNKPPRLHTGGLSALEGAFAELGWPDPKECPDSSCDIKGCQKWPGSGNPLDNGDYLNLCTEHMLQMDRQNSNGLVKKRGRGYNAKERAERLKRFASYRRQNRD